MCLYIYQVTQACKKHGGFYLGSIGGPAAILAKNCIKKVEVLEYPELGMYSGLFPAILGKGPWPKLGKNDRLNIKFWRN